MVTTQNLFDHGERGLAMVASPEEIVFESTAAGRGIVDVSARPSPLTARRPRRDRLVRQFAVKQGVAGPQWQRPELYDVIYPKKPLREAAE